MSSLSIQNFFSTSFTAFENQFLSSLTAQQKKVAMIALAVFAVIASVALISCCCFQAKKEELEDEMEDVDSQVAAKVNKSPSVQSDKDIETQKSLPQSERTIEIQTILSQLANAEDQTHISHVRKLAIDWINLLDRFVNLMNLPINIKAGAACQKAMKIYNCLGPNLDPMDHKLAKEFALESIDLWHQFFKENEDLSTAALEENGEFYGAAIGVYTLINVNGADRNQDEVKKYAAIAQELYEQWKGEYVFSMHLAYQLASLEGLIGNFTQQLQYLDDLDQITEDHPDWPSSKQFLKFSKELRAKVQQAVENNKS
jgi:outer membrane murein-binding lipoprotein Lpp